MKALWNKFVLAESNHTKKVDNTYYFPPDSLNTVFFHPSHSHSVSPKKGKAKYFDILVGDKRNRDAAMYFPHPDEDFMEIKDHVTFLNGVEIID